MAFELMLKGLLSNESRSLKTALVIDELEALLLGFYTNTNYPDLKQFVFWQRQEGLEAIAV